MNDTSSDIRIGIATPAEPDLARSPLTAWPWKTVFVLFVVLASILAPVAVDAVWIKRTALDTEHFVAQIAPMIEDPHVQHQIADIATERLTAKLDLRAQLTNVLPDRLGFLAATADRQIVEFIRSQALSIVASPGFANVFRATLTTSHSFLIRTLTGEGNRLSVEDGTVLLDLTDLRDQIVNRVEASPLRGFVQLDTSQPLMVTVVKSPELTKAQWFIRLLKLLGFWLPVVFVVCGAAAVRLASNRRRGLIWVATGVSISMVLHLAALAFGRDFYLSAVTQALDRDASEVVYDLLMKFPTSGSRVALVVSLAVIAVASMFGPTPWAVQLRAAVLGAPRRGVDVVPDGPLVKVFEWIATQRRLLMIATASIGLLFVAFADPLSRSRLLWIAIVVVVVVSVIAVLAWLGHQRVIASDSTDESAAAESTESMV